MAEPFDHTNSDSTGEESEVDDYFYDELFIDILPSQDKCEHDVQDIHPYKKCCEKCLDHNLMFFMGSLQEACQAAFSPTSVQERRPVLVYIHNHGELFKRKFCETMFNSSPIINYLDVNYVVWSWEMRSNVQKNTLTNIWRDVFSVPFMDNVSIDRYPLLIGITRLCEYENDGLKINEYQFEKLVENNTLVLTKKTMDHDILFNNLVSFKEKCDKNEKNLADLFTQ